MDENENNNNNEKQYHTEKQGCLKYVGLFLAVLIGTFLAVYVVVDITISRFMDPFGMMGNMSRMENEAFKDFDKNAEVPMMPPPQSRHHLLPPGIMKPPTVDFVKLPDAYKFIINLNDFGKNPKNIGINVENKTITINGENKKSSKHSDSFSTFSESFTLDDDAEFSKMSKKTVHNKYIITVPIEDED